MKNHPYLLLCVILLYLRCSSCEQRCTPRTEVNYKRNFYVGEHDLTFRIEASQRISHQIVSHIARILLKEILGYPYVNIVYPDTASTLETLQKMSSCRSPDKTTCDEVEDETGPEVMINLELWLTPGFNLERWTKTDRVEDCGPLGPIGRAAWYIDKRVVDYFWEKNATVIDHYRAFLNPELTATFDLTKEPSVISKTNQTCRETAGAEKYGCGKDGFYRPPWCSGEQNITCATILSDYPHSTFHVLEKIIKRFGLLVNIAWLGDGFEKEIWTLIQGNIDHEKPNIVFYYKQPMMIPVNITSTRVTSLSHVTFPECENDLSQCEFEVNQLQKVVWREIKSSAPFAYQVIRSLTFSHEDYNSLLNDYYLGVNRILDYRDIACEWVKDNSITWTKWIPINAHNKNTLYIGGIFPLTGVYWRQNSTVEAAKMAVDAINKNKSLLLNYNLEILEANGQCATDEVMKSFINYLRNDTYKFTVGILGPACSDTVEPIAGVANHFNIMIISYSAEGTLFNNRDKYRFFFRTIPENNLFRFVFIKLFKALGYTRVASLTEDGQKYPEYLSYLQDLMKSHDMTFIENRKFPRERTFTNMSLYLEDLNRKGAKIIIGDFYDYAARDVMCTAYKLRMTAENGYVWFLPSWYPHDWYDTDVKNKLNNSRERVPCTTEEMIEAINGHISLSYKFYADSDNVMQEDITVGEWKTRYGQYVEEQKKLPSTYAGYTYDAVWVYALALDRLLNENDSHVATLHTHRTSKKFVEFIQETHFEGVTGPVFFNNGSRICDVIITQWMNKNRSVIGTYKAFSLDEGQLELNESQIKWLTPDGKKPDDGTRDFEDCDVESLRVFLGNVKCDTAKIAANVIGVSSFVIIVIIGILIYKRRYDQRMKSTKKKMKELRKLADTLPNSLDEWELPRDRIVINRKIGEGAFGTVYGGEALVGNLGWTAVALKSLKRGSKIEEKLDFLGEAEVMKQFDHINIVKLIGVCTTEEPVYTVMEFMLYGDLKTYLLSRRHMASVKDRTNNEEVSDRRLTNMALDIARGLSYLADKKYVHRDLACRNCLVNTSRSVKIGDFGMCRKMFDHDYYRYSKKGMLPIRWMAPESLVDGLFTPMSDVWSYGVVLYEIITFASYPYQGLSHQEVLAHVKSFNTLPVPNGCKPALEVLLRQCWSSTPTDRPKAAAIVEILALDPELITPCLDLPAHSVELEPSTLDIKMIDRARGHSFSSVWQTRKNANLLDPCNLGIFDTTQIPQAAIEIVQPTKHSGFKHPNKRSLHESFKRPKRDFNKERTNFMPQNTYL